MMISTTPLYPSLSPEISPSSLHFSPLPSPLQEISDAPFYSDEDDEEEDSEEDSDEDEDDEKEKKKKKKSKKKPYIMDNDHRLLLRNAKPLLQSRSAAVSPSHFSYHMHVM